MSDALWAAREGDALLHTSMMADIVGGVLEVAATVAIGALATAAVAAALGITVATGGLGCFVLGAVVGLVVGVAMAATGADTGLSRLCEGIGNFLFPPSVQATIASGSPDTKTNGKPAARAAGVVIAPPAPLEGGAEGADEPEESFLDMTKGFFSQMWRPTVASPAANTQEANDDKVVCSKHPPMPPQYLAEGSSKVLINGHPAARSGDRSTCEAVIVDGGLVSNNVRIGGEPIVVREIRSGKTPGIGLAITALMLLRGRGGKFYSRFGCMLIGGVSSYVSGQVTSALTSAIVGSPNPVHAPTGAKLLNGEEDLDFNLPGPIPLPWQRYYNSRDERRDGLFGPGWSVAYEVFVEFKRDAGTERLLFTDEQARVIDMGQIPKGDAVFSASEGLSVRHALNGELLIESLQGVYRLFEPTPGNPDRLRLSQLGDRNDNRLYLDYDDLGRLACLRDSSGQIEIHLRYCSQWPQRLLAVDRHYPQANQSHPSRETLVSYRYDANGNLAQVEDALACPIRQFGYDAGARLTLHQTYDGLQCCYEWASFDDGWRVVRHWTNEGDEYRFEYDLGAGITRITDGLQRVSTRRWNPQYQVTSFTNALGDTWHFEWNDERQLLGAQAPDGGQWQYFYDESGNLAESIDPLGRSESFQWLEHWALPRARTDRAGNRWQYRYDPRGNRTRETDPLGQVTRYRYDAHGQVVEIIDAAGKHKQLHWNPLGQLKRYTDCSAATTRFDYDHRGHLQAVTNALGECTTYERDIRGYLTAIVRPDGRREHFEHDALGRLVRYSDTGGQTSLYSFNRQGKAWKSIDPLGHQVEYRYDPYGRLSALSNANGEHYRFSWDPLDRLIDQQELDGGGRRYRYDATDNLIALEFYPSPAFAEANPAAIVHQYTRDAAGRMVGKTTDDGFTEYRYDALDQLLEVLGTDRDGNTQRVAFAYDALGQNTEEHTAGGVLRRVYDELGNPLQTQLPDGRWLNRHFYGNGHLHHINLDGLLLCDFERDRLHRETLRVQGRLATQSEYDRSGRVHRRQSRQLDQASQLLAPFQESYQWSLADDLAGHFSQQPGQQHQQWLRHDAAGRIIARQDAHDGTHEAFAYDAAANLIDPAQAPAKPVRHNRLSHYQDKRYRYDAFGRLLEKRSRRWGTQHFHYDAEHRLVRVDSHQAGRERVLRMRYDPLGRRLEKTEYDGQGRLLNQTSFTWEGQRLLSERRNGRASLYVYANDGFEPLARIDGQGQTQQVCHFHNDVNGLPNKLTDDQGKLLWQASYQVWGNTLREEREARFIDEQNLRFQGQYLDRETGLHYNLHRYYDPDIGRFTQPDPIGLYGGLNLYAYGPNPFTWIDPLGLDGIFTRTVFEAPSGNVHTVYQQDIDWDLKVNTRNGVKTNRQLVLEEKRSPMIVKNGKYEVVHLHHSKQNGIGSLFELSADTHNRFHKSKALHPHLPNAHPHNPVNRSAFDIDREAYWKQRATASMKGGGKPNRCGA